jgi:hypothetical protein
MLIHNSSCGGNENPKRGIGTDRFVARDARKTLAIEKERSAQNIVVVWRDRKLLPEIEIDHFPRVDVTFVTA